jgi:citrate lyase beta subunit
MLRSHRMPRPWQRPAPFLPNAKGVGMVDGQMIDEAIARKARHILAAAGLDA